MNLMLWENYGKSLHMQSKENGANILDLKCVRRRMCVF